MNLEDQIARITNPQEFTRLCNTVFTAVYKGDFQVIDGTRGDEGNDGYIATEGRILAIYCPIKPERKTDKDYLDKALSDLAKVVKLRDSGKFAVGRWTFVTPRKLSADVLSKIREEALIHELVSTHIESTYLACALREHIHLIPEFPDLYVARIEEYLKELLSQYRTATDSGRQDESDINCHQVYEPPTAKEMAKDADDEMARVRVLRSEKPTDATKKELRVVSYKSTNPIVQLNAILGVLELFNPVTDDPADAVALCDRGIAVATRVKTASVQAVLLAQKGCFLNQLFLRLDMETWYQIQVENSVGIGMVTEKERRVVQERLNELQRLYATAFTQAFTLVKETKSGQAIASVLTYFGTSAGLRALQFGCLKVSERAAAERNTCRSALLAAKDIYDSLGDELGVANAVFNLANQIRFFGEEKEAKELVLAAMEVAKKHGDERLLQKAGWLLRTLETGRCPDHLAGERYE